MSTPSLPRSTLVELFFEAVETHRGRVALQRMVSERALEDITYEQVLATVKLVTAALLEHGIERGDRVAILSENRPEWALADYGCLCAGAWDVPVYATLTAPQVAYLFQDSGAKLVFASNEEEMTKALEAASQAGP